MLKPMTLAALVLVTACAAQTTTEVHTAPPTLASVYPAEPLRAAPEYRAPPAADCEIRETRTANGVRLEAITHAGQSLRGSYDFIVTAYSAGGSSDITQGGPVDLVAGQGATVGSAEIPRGRYRAVLTLTDAGGVLCDSERRS